MYKFVTAGVVDLQNRDGNADLLDSGTLYVARFNDDGTGVWLPMVGGEGALATWSHAEVLVNTRGAAAAVGGTKMDKPEGFQPSPVTGKLYCSLTNNPARGALNQPAADAANPRANNVNGHVLELVEAGGDHSATAFTWEVFIRCGDPARAADDTYFAGFDPAEVSPISNPDYLTFDNAGHLWIGTDGLSKGLKGMNDGLFAVPVEGAQRGYLRQFMSGPVGAEITGPRFNRDNSALFVSVQHPGRTGTLAAPTSVWPDGDIAKPAVVVVTKTRGHRTIGS
jgi:secreted PhoX family phosphatase